MKRTGHRSLEGVRIYKRTSETQNEEASSILNADQASLAKKPKISSPDDMWHSRRIIDLPAQKHKKELFIPCCSPYLALSSGTCGASIRASVPEL